MPKNSVPLFNTYIHRSAKKEVGAVLDSTFLSEGKKVAEFESKLNKEFNIANPVAVTSGTTALHVALVVAGVGRGDEVILPAQTFLSSALVIVQQGAKPVFADINCETGNIDPASIKSKITKKTKAIMPVHWGGYPCDMNQINAIARKHKLMVIEDAAHALGATYKGKMIGSLSDFTCFSFQATKQLTTGDGGAVGAKKKFHYEELIRRRWLGIDRKRDKTGFLGERVYNIDELGYKYHMNDYAAALGLANLKGIKANLKHRRNIAKKYQKAFAKNSDITLLSYEKDRESSYQFFGMHVTRRDAFIKHMRKHNIGCSIINRGIDANKLFGGKQKSLKQQRKFEETIIHIPIHDALTDSDVRYIIQTINNGW